MDIKRQRTFANANSLTLCTYTPSAGDISAGSITLTLTATGNAPCSTATSNKTLTINSAPTAVAGTPVISCYSSGSINVTAGSSASNQASVTWDIERNRLFFQCQFTYDCRLYSQRC